MPASLNVFKQAYLAWDRDHASYFAGAISYGAIFSLAPLLIVILAITSRIYGADSTQQAFLIQLQSVVGPESAEFIQSMLDKANLASTSGIAFIVGITLTLVGSIGVFRKLKQAVDLIWDEPKTAQTVLQYLGRYSVLFLLVLLSSVLLLGALIVSALITRSNAYLSQLIGFQTTWPLALANAGVSFCLITAFFGILFKALPNTSIPWRRIWPAAFTTALLFSLGKFALALYLRKSGATSAYGAAGSLAVLLIWIYYAAQVFLYGIELVKVQELAKSKTFFSV